MSAFWTHSRGEGLVHGPFLLWEWAGPNGWVFYEAADERRRALRIWKKTHHGFASRRAATIAAKKREAERGE